MDNLCMCKLCDHWEDKGCYPACTSKFERFSMNKHDAKVRADAIEEVLDIADHCVDLRDLCGALRLMKKEK